MKTPEIICVCGYGLGTSLILKMQLEEVLKEAGIEANVEPLDITSAAGAKADIIFTSEEFHDQLAEANTIPVIAISDYLNKELLQQTALPEIQKLLDS